MIKFSKTLLAIQEAIERGKMADQSILKLVEYGVQTGLLPESERTYAANLLLDLMHGMHWIKRLTPRRIRNFSAGSPE